MEVSPRHLRRQRGPVKGLSAHYPLRQCLQAQHSQSQQIFKFSGRKHTEHGGILGFPKEMCEIARRKILSKIPHKSAESASSKLDQCRCDFQIELATKKTERYRLKFAYHCMVHVNWESQSSGCAVGGSKVLWSIQLTAFSLFSLFPRSTFFSFLLFCRVSSRLTNISPAEFMRVERAKPCGLAVQHGVCAIYEAFETKRCVSEQ